MICRVTSLVVSEQNRSRGIGEQLLAAAANRAACTFPHQRQLLKLATDAGRFAAWRIAVNVRFGSILLKKAWH
jgi:N-acetylglutamate synthase-like GNAT family acetyltransferase